MCLIRVSEVLERVCVVLELEEREVFSFLKANPVRRRCFPVQQPKLVGNAQNPLRKWMVICFETQGNNMRPSTDMHKETEAPEVIGV